jgi:predicted DNA-binding transcriptional regulator AlpA
MTSNTSGSGMTMPYRPVTGPVQISRWVNETYPNSEKLLSSHEVAKLTRQHRWTLVAWSLIGRFPKRRRYRGRSIGWCRADVLAWMTRNLNLNEDSCSVSRSPGPRRAREQQLLRETGRVPDRQARHPNTSRVSPCLARARPSEWSQK